MTIPPGHDTVIMTVARTVAQRAQEGNMLWELMRQGYLPHWWEYVTFVACMLILVVCPVVIWAIWTTRPPRRPR